MPSYADYYSGSLAAPQSLLSSGPYMGVYGSQLNAMQARRTGQSGPGTTFGSNPMNYGVHPGIWGTGQVASSATQPYGGTVGALGHQSIAPLGVQQQNMGGGTARPLSSLDGGQRLQPGLNPGYLAMMRQRMQLQAAQQPLFNKSGKPYPSVPSQPGGHWFGDVPQGWQRRYV